MLFFQPFVFVSTYLKDFKMQINLDDTVPVRKANCKMHRNLYAEMGEYINDLVTNGWISGVVFFLCVSYCVCQEEIWWSAHVLRLLEIEWEHFCWQPTNSPNTGYSWYFGWEEMVFYSALDLSKAYHQCYIHEGRRHLTLWLHGHSWAMSG